MAGAELLIESHGWIGGSVVGSAFLLRGIAAALSCIAAATVVLHSKAVERADDR
jgi:hypothetical protein